MRLRIFLIIFLIICCFSYANADEGMPVEKAAQEEAPQAVEKDYIATRHQLERVITEKEEEMPQELDSYIRVLPACKARAQDGHLSVIETAMEYTYDLKAFGKIPVELGIGTRYFDINNTTDVTLPSTLSSIFFGAEVTLPFFKLDKTYLRIAVSPTINSDNYNTNSTAMRVTSQYFVIYQPDEKWTWVLGVAVFPGYQDKVAPIAGFIYKPNDKLIFNITPERPSIIYTLNDKFDVFTEFDYDSHEFKVTKDGQSGVALDYQDMHLGAGLNYKLNKNITSTFALGSVFKRTLKYGDSLGKVNIKNGGYAEFRIDIQM